ncbi:MAG: HNH endonuclease [bacterium]
MNHCIYCSKKIELQRTKEHIFPACISGDKILPDGYVCDECNNYFSEMDRVFLHNNYIANTVLTEEIPNRRGKIRYKLSDRWTYLGNRQFAFTLEPVSLLNKKSAIIKITQSREFDELLFARAVHKVAFNCFARLWTEKEILAIIKNLLSRKRKDNCIPEEKFQELVFLIPFYSKVTRNLPRSYFRKKDEDEIRIKHEIIDISEWSSRCSKSLKEIMNEKGLTEFPEFIERLKENK